ncbi:LEM domain-containing protein 1 [Phascolarctos cinereus]|uniref:LEM domain-containing protein 1 n=1 Tax=Phascolarctos cinereus TaxID=38626 RepID=A0A6P5LQ87_PHACI|nr:LEM domain-containing protein 1 [Phascolarctos cinereus]XP_020858565.1 LEM domain-containing protein 1 [Phascolarctos cinereus]XP_020858566.1 LEM domain-containing protein 1 [Phascolarctos cinereus]XP_020858567.1 LEM domain-containing protein 1 [Phascolarctos cinereus]XP_020858568.1 LEM domain-containing protein 1 [Phascolarctos cinereus]
MAKEEDEIPISMEDIKNLTDSELQEQLMNHGYNSGTIIPSTRRVYEDKLLQLLTTSNPSTERKVKKKTKEPPQHLEGEEEEEDVDVVLEKKIKISPRKTKRPKKEKSSVQKSTKRMNYEIEESNNLVPLHKKLSSVHSVDGDIDIYYPDPSTHRGIRITIRRPLKTKREDSRTMLEDVKIVEKKIGVISVAFIIAVLFIFTVILFVYLIMEKKVITV